MTTDTEALDTIAQLLRDTNWKTDPGLLSDVASVVRSTGRDVMNTVLNAPTDDTDATGYAVPQSELRDGFGGIA